MGKKVFYKSTEENSSNTKVSTCEDCGLCYSSKSGEFPVVGKGGKRILIVGDPPTKKEDDLNEPMNTKSLDYLKDALNLVGVDLEEDCWYVPGIRCKPTFVKGKIKVPPQGFNVCRDILFEDIENLKPKTIITLGPDALKVLIGNRLKGRANFTPFSKWPGWEIPDQELGCYIYPLESPRSVLERYDHPIVERKFIQGLETASKQKSFYTGNYESDVTVILDEEGAVKALEDLWRRDTLAFDYETTGLKPQREGHRILCVSFSDGFHSWAFPIFDTVRFHKAMMKILKSKRIKKIAHNMKYEHIWTKQILNYTVNNWHHDCMLGAHVLDNRKSITNLKFQTYVNFGVLGYDDGVDVYMNKTPEGEDKKSGNRFNSLAEVPMEELCTYCALDSLFTYKLYDIQIGEMWAKRVDRGYKILHNAALTFADMELAGIKIDLDQLEENLAILDSEMERLDNEIKSDPRLKLWDGEEEFNYNSTKQLGHLLFDIMKYPIKNRTAKGQPSTDKEALEEIPERFVQKMLERKKLDKIKTTYLLGTKREVVDGFIHPSFNNGNVQSYRVSSQNPNYQNLASHDKFARQMVLSPIIPRNDFIVAVDEKSLEVMIGACYHKDPKMLEFLELGEAADMHRTVSSKVFLCEESEVTKDMRQVGKTINFSNQYGAAPFTIAKRSWEKMFTKEMKAFLRKRGIKNFPQYSKHIEKVMEWYWKELFSVYGQWCKDNWKSYLENGYTKLKIGLKCTDIMRYTQANNFLIQGAAANLVCFAMTKVNDYIKENKLKSRIILYIHDSIEFDVAEEEWEELREVIHYWMTKGIQEHFPWVVAPLGIEAEYHYSNFCDVDETEKLGMWVDKSV